MSPENLDVSDITDARRKAIEKSIRPIGVEELKGVENEIFPYHDDPWRERFSEFVQANSGSAFYHATTHDHLHIIYCHGKEKGIWYLPGSGLGPLQEKGLKIMKKVVEKI
jgi:hypothetical protein